MNIIVPIVAPILPTLLLILGGQFLVNMYEDKKKRREQEVELLRFIREQRYEAV